MEAIEIHIFGAFLAEPRQFGFRGHTDVTWGISILRDSHTLW